MRKFLLAVIMVLIGTSSAIGDVHYVTPAGDGGKTGEDWSNAYEGLPASLIRGDTYYISEGAYSARAFNDAESGTSVITIKKCGSSDTTCTAAAGYSASNHDGQAVFSSSSTSVMIFNKGYYVLDGVTGGGPDAWTSGHGIKLDYTDTTPSAPVVDVVCTTSAPMPGNITISHVEFQQPGREYNCAAVTGAGTGSLIIRGKASSCTDWTPGGFQIDHNYMHGNPTQIFLGYNIKDSIFEYNWFQDCAAYYHTDSCTSSNQGSGITSYGWNNVDIRYNVLTNLQAASPGIGLYTWHGEKIAGVVTYPITNLRIYGNLIYNDKYSPFDSSIGNAYISADGCNVVSDQSCDGTDPVVDNVYVYNNTFANITAPNTLNIATSIISSNVIARNNLWLLGEGVTVSNGAFTGFDTNYDIFFGMTAYQASASLGYNATPTSNVNLFESWDGDSPNYWTAVNCTTEDVPSYIPHAVSRDLTNDAVKVTATSANGYIYHDYTTTGSTLYRMTVNFKNTTGDESRIWIYDVTHSAYIGESGGYAFDSHTEWTKVTHYFTTPSGATSVRVMLGATNNGDVVYYDTISIKPSIDANLGGIEANEQVLSELPVVSFSTSNYRLTGSTENGADLGATYNTDAYGNTRSAWDRGAYEYETESDTTPTIKSKGLKFKVNFN